MEELVATILADSKSAERESKRRQYYLQISRTLNEYLLRAKNLRDAFRYLPDLAYGNKRIAQDLSNAIAQYNQVVDSMKINQDALVEEVSVNWQKPDLARNLREILRYALLDIHETDIIVFNEMHAKIITIVKGSIKDEQEMEAAKMNIKATVPGRVETLNAKLVQLERNSLAFLDALKP